MTTTPYFRRQTTKRVTFANRNRSRPLFLNSGSTISLRVQASDRNRLFIWSSVSQFEVFILTDDALVSPAKNSKSRTLTEYNSWKELTLHLVLRDATYRPTSLHSRRVAFSPNTIIHNGVDSTSHPLFLKWRCSSCLIFAGKQLDPPSPEFYLLVGTTTTQSGPSPTI